MNAKNELTLFEPGAFMRRVFPEFERLFAAHTIAPFRGARGEPEFPWVPELEVFERDNRLTVRLDVPGLKKEEVTVKVTEEGLTIEGERKHEKEEKKNNWHRTERTYGKFFRVIPLPEGVTAAEVTATFRSGVLEITAPLPAAAVVPPAHNVEIRGEEEKVAVKAA
jgi:HSP20 family protein